jgi:hypothetical protein
MHTHKVPARIQRNVMSAALSPTAPVPLPTAAEVIREWPLSRLALYIRQLSNSVTQDSHDKKLDMVATARDRTALNIRIDSYPPMSILQTDHRDVNIATANFGFVTPVSYHQLWYCISEGQSINQSIIKILLTCSSPTIETSSYAGASPVRQNLYLNASRHMKWRRANPQKKVITTKTPAMCIYHLPLVS